MEINGLLLIDKPAGLTSHDVVARVRRILRQKSIGHTGTLDPMASGLMVLVLGEATKLSNYILDGNKAYELKLALGFETDTLDATGQVLRECSPEIVRNAQPLLAEFSEQLQGDFTWPIPMYSAKKIDGEKLYEIARRGEDITVPKKVMSFWGLKQLSEAGGQYLIHCSKGSFVRTWVQQLGLKLGCGATLTELRRVYCEPYSISGAVSLEVLEELVIGGKDLSETCLIRLEEALVDVKRLFIRGQDLTLMKNGQISHDLRRQLIGLFDPERDKLVQVFGFESKKLLSIIGLEPGRGFVIRRVFNES